MHVLSLPPAFVLSQNQTLKLRFDTDETSSVMDKVAAKHLRIFDGKPVHIDPTHVGPDINWLSLDKRKPSMSIIGSHSSRSLFENPASNTAARVSLPLTMSNISRTNGLSPGYPPHPFWPDWPAPFARGRGIRPSPLSRQPPFLNFFQHPEGDRKPSKKEPTKFASGPSRGPRATNYGRREEAIYAPPIRRASGFWLKMLKPRVFHRTRSLASRIAKSHRFRAWIDRDTGAPCARYLCFGHTLASLPQRHALSVFDGGMTEQGFRR